MGRNIHDVLESLTTNIDTFTMLRVTDDSLQLLHVNLFVNKPCFETMCSIIDTSLTNLIRGLQFRM